MSLYYDSSRDCYVDPENGATIPRDLIDTSGDSINKKVRKGTNSSKNMNNYETDLQLALRLSKEHQQQVSINDVVISNDVTLGSMNNENGVYSSIPANNTNDVATMRSRLTTFFDVSKRLIPANFYGIPSPPRDYTDPSSLQASLSEAPENPSDDWTLARAMQLMEFEMDEDMMEMNELGEFVRHENKASSCKSQMMTLSTVIVLIQIIILICMIQEDGYVPRSENPMIGPSAQTLVNFGAKEAGLIILWKQWWRLLSAIFVHAGILHLLSNGAIQLRVGGYLSNVFGTFKWFLIYFISGIFGNICSCIFFKDSISVGSSGSILGMLTAWLVWIIYRWKKIPKRAQMNRNIQLFIVFACVAITLGTSFSAYIDWAAHFGGAILGGLSAAFLLSDELENPKTKLAIRCISGSISIVLIIVALYYMLDKETTTVFLPPTN